MKAYSNARAEFSRLRELYLSSCYAFDQTEEVLRYKAKRRQAVDQDLVVVRPIQYSLKHSFGARVRGQLRELTFIRLVSVLEAYLVDTVRDIFFITKQPFKDQDVQVTFTQAEILSADSMSYVLSKIVNKECRRLTSGGFIEILKFYRSRFSIDLTTLKPGKAVMGEYHERRHIFVHRLGKPDSKYRKTYAFAGNQLTVDEAYLNACFGHFEAFVEAVNQHLTTWLGSVASQNQRAAFQASVKYLIFLQKDRDSDPALFNEDFQFWVGDELYAFRDILKSKKFLSQHECELVIAGDSEALLTYGKYLRRAEKQGHLISSQREAQGLEKRAKKNLDPELIAKIQQNLPSQPWPTGIHKTIAQQLGLSNGVISDAIQVLISRGAFKRQIDGKIVENT